MSSKLPMSSKLSLYLYLLLCFAGTLRADPITPPNCTAGPASVHCGKTPAAVWQENRLWVVFVQGKRLYVTHTEDQGKHYSTAVRVNPEPETIETNGENRPKIALTNKALIISWTRKTDGRFTGDIRLSRSLDGGKTFEQPKTINDDNQITSHRFDSLLASPEGTVYIAWLDKRNRLRAQKKNEDYSGSAVYYAVSDDHGKQFSDNVAMADNSCECCRLAVAPAEENRLAVFWRHIYDTGQQKNTRDHGFAIVSPAGKTVSLTRATFDNWHIDACPHHGPDLATGTTGYHLAWFSGGGAKQGIHYGFYDTDESAVRHEVTMDASAGAGHPQVIQHENTVYYAWKLFDGEQTQIQLMTSNDSGKSWSEPRTLAVTGGSSDYPLLITSDSGVYLTWHTENEGFRIIATTLKAPDTAKALQPFNTESMKEIESKYRGRMFVVALWSATCPPCLHELNILSEWRKANPDIPLVLISTDGQNEAITVARTIAAAGLINADNWIFADSYVEKLRFRIDPSWRGELPRSYLYSPAGKRLAISGALTTQILQNWQSGMQ